MSGALTGMCVVYCADELQCSEHTVHVGAGPIVRYGVGWGKGGGHLVSWLVALLVVPWASLH